jgi:hypothetical protein
MQNSFFQNRELAQDLIEILNLTHLIEILYSTMHVREHTVQYSSPNVSAPYSSIAPKGQLKDNTRSILSQYRLNHIGVHIFVTNSNM